MTASFMQQAGIVREPPFFNGVRSNDWSPRFHRTETVEEAADHINRPHEDYPRRVGDTEQAIRHVMQLNEDAKGQLTITLDLVREVHRMIFPDHGEQAGQWRQVNVRVGTHNPPRWEFMDSMMAELEFHYLELQRSRNGLTLQSLRDWYFDVETVHPFRDGNGRVGGTIIAALSHRLRKGFLTPGQ